MAARIVLGHWVGDSIKSAAGRSAIGTLVERTGRDVMLVRLEGLSAQYTLDGYSRRLREIPASLRKTPTCDHGSEMGMHRNLARRLRMEVHFRDAHSLGQRGSDENANGIIREFLPKGIDVASVTAQDLRRIEYVMHNTPRQRLGFAAPHEVFGRIRLDQIDGVALQAWGGDPMPPNPLIQRTAIGRTLSSNASP